MKARATVAFLLLVALGGALIYQLTFRGKVDSPPAIPKPLISAAAQPLTPLDEHTFLRQRSFI
jgi:hypothetical protein